jgi:anaerobic ribonucleoside-triphosphate reductase
MSNNEEITKFLANENIIKFSQQQFTKGTEYKVNKHKTNVLGDRKVYELIDNFGGTHWLNDNAIKKYNLTPL